MDTYLLVFPELMLRLFNMACANGKKHFSNTSKLMVNSMINTPARQSTSPGFESWSW